jgi:hypothetical protein
LLQLFTLSALLELIDKQLQVNYKNNGTFS